MTTRAADDFAAIRKRMAEIKEVATTASTPKADVGASLWSMGLACGRCYKPADQCVCETHVSHWGYCKGCNKHVTECAC